jgi:hypothetical protein
LVPLSVTVAPTAPLVGLNPVKVGVPNTTKLVVLVTVTPLTVTEIGPVVAPPGTRVVMVVDVDASTAANTPLNRTVLFPGIVLKLIPVIITVALMAPLPGLKLVILGESKTVKSVKLVTVTPLTVIDIGPVVAPDGTRTVKEDVEAEVIDA